MRNQGDWDDGTLGLLLLGLLALLGSYMLSIWQLWKWVESGYK